MPLGPVNPDYVPHSKDERTQVAGAAKANFDSYKQSSLAANVPIKITADTVYKFVEPKPPVKPDGISDSDWSLYLAGQDKVSGEWVPDTQGQLLYDQWQNTLDASIAAGASDGAAQSYMSSEANKTKEITRQYNDFQDRANELYDLMDAEQGFAMNADDQNAQNAAARAKGYLLPGEGLQYTPYVMGGPLSEILRPSLPDYVRPDYRNNAAVGLPGPEGFDDPQYDENGMPMYAYGTDWQPGMVPTAGLPGQLPSIDYPSWVGAAVDGIIFNLRDGSGANDGKPADWDSSRYGDWNRIVQLAQYPAGVPQAARTALYDYVQNSGAKGDLSYALGLGAAPSPSGNDYTTPPLTPSEQLARDQFEFQKAQALLKLATGGGSSGGTSTPRISTPRTSGGGGGGSASSLADDLALLNARTDASSSLAQQEFDLKKELMLLQFQLDNDPNNPNLLLKRDQLAEQVRQFNATLALQEKSQQNETAKVIADYSANPVDAVAREYFLRGKAQPVGNAVNIFTGQPTGQQMTFSQMMQANAPAAGAALNASLTGQPAQTQQPDTAATEQPVEDQTPQYALGTGDYSPPPMSGQMPAHSPRPTPFSMPSTARRPEITPDGWTRAKQFIAGDPQIPGTENPEHIKMRVRNGEPEAKVTPLSHMMRGHRMPMYADGTSDPFYGTTYQGMDPNAVVTNANSQYYGMTAQQAFDAQNRNILNLQSYDPRAVDSLGQATGYAPAIVVGPTVGMTSGGFTGADPVKNPEAFWSDPGYWIGDTSTPRQVINVNNQADAGILTGAQMSNGVTQSAAPGLPGYQRPSDLPPLPGSGSMGVTTSTDTTQGGTQTDSVKPATSSATPTSGEAGGPTNEPTVPTSNGITAPTTTGINLGAPDAGGNKLVMGPGTFTKDGATYTLQQGDYQRPDGTWVRYDPIYKEYMPIQPTSYTPITSEDQFWRLPDDVRQKIMRGEPTGYALVGNWRDSLFAGYGGGSTILPREQYLGLPEAEQRALLNGTSTDPAQFGPAGAPLPYQYHDPRVAFGPMQGGLSGLLRMGFDQTDRGPNLNDYYPYLVNRGAGGSADIPINDAAARVLGVPTQAEQAAIEQAIMNAANPPVPQPTTPPPAGTGTGATSGSGAGTTTGTGTGTTNGTGTGTGTGTTTGTGTGTGTGTTTGTGSTSALAQALAQLLGLSYGSGAYQNLPSLLFAGGGDAGQYDTVSNQPIEVPGLGITLPSASQMMNYEMLNKLQQNGSFDLLNSLYTAGNVPLSILLKMAEARAPRGSAYEPGLVSTV